MVSCIQVRSNIFEVAKSILHRKSAMRNDSLTAGRDIIKSLYKNSKSIVVVSLVSSKCPCVDK